MDIAKRQAIMDLVCRFLDVLEGFKAKAYWDATGHRWSLGFGTTIGVTRDDTCTREQAVAWMLRDCAELVSAVEHLPLFEAAALVLFGYNCGLDDMQRVLNGKLKVMPDGYVSSDDGKRFGCVSGGVELSGLVKRRRLEAGIILASRSLQPTI